MIVYVFVYVLGRYLSKTKYGHFVVRKQGANDCYCTAFSGLLKMQQRRTNKIYGAVIEELLSLKHGAAVWVHQMSGTLPELVRHCKIRATDPELCFVARPCESCVGLLQ